VDTIHTVVNWSRFAPHVTSRKVPRGFNGRDPRAYGATNWDIYDSLVRGAAARGISVMMSPSGPIPNWASRCKHNKYSACKPDPKLYRDFVTALARRYSGKWVDEDQEQTALPKVSRWSPWNEPNLGVWLYPQTTGKRGHRVYIGAAYYRKLVYAARAALDATGHRNDRFLVGETAPLGGGATRTPPGDFLRGLFCLDDHGKRFTGKMAKLQGCVHAKRIRASGISHHPYGRGAGVPTGRKQRPGAITIGTIGRLLPIIRAARKHSRVAPRKLGVYITEFGVTTRPPDTKFGVPLARQAQYLNLVDYLAYKRPWIKSVSQYQLVDDTGLAVRGTFQTGLIFRTNVLKPSFAAYRIPIFVLRRKGGVTVFGQIRPVRAGKPAAKVDIQNRAKRGAAWKTLRTLKTNRRGYLLQRFRQKKGAWRIRWVEPDGTISYSRGSDSVPSSTPTTPGLPPPGSGTPPSPQPPSTNPGTPPPAPEEPPAAPPPPQYTLTVALEGAPNSMDVLLMRPGGGSVASSPAGIDCGTTCSASYVSGTSVTLTATPDANSTFSGWSGDCTGSGTCVVPMSVAHSVKATFTRNFP
jgi:hypothetical protein